jgi:hypothetical protein
MVPSIGSWSIRPAQTYTLLNPYWTHSSNDQHIYNTHSLYFIEVFMQRIQELHTLFIYEDTHRWKGRKQEPAYINKCCLYGFCGLRREFSRLPLIVYAPIQGNHTHLQVLCHAKLRSAASTKLYVMHNRVCLPNHFRWLGEGRKRKLPLPDRLYIRTLTWDSGATAM